MKRIAIYSRKSKFTGKGESIGNQIEMCKEYIRMRYGNDVSVTIYEDEGFSGGSTERPKFQEMMTAIRKGNFDITMCYRLDRLSRNTSDFVIFIQELNENNVQFVSVNEQFDTTTIMGRAMMNIASVFAQMEREIIAERIRDNMLELAKTGRWLGGMCPTGYQSEKVQKVEFDGKVRQAYMLVPIEGEKDLIKLIFNKYLQEQSLTNLETYLIQNNIKTKNGNAFTRFTIKTILENPVYAVADRDMLHFFQRLELDIFADEGDFNGKYGVMAYNKTEQTKNKSNKKRDMSEWIISVGKHKGFVSGNDWIKVQDILEKNTDKRYKKPIKNTSILTGLVICNKCGSYMRPKLHRPTSDVFSYICELKEKSRGQNCDCGNISGNELDEQVLLAVKQIFAPNSEICIELKKIIENQTQETMQTNSEEIMLKNQYKKNKDGIAKLVDNIKYANSEAVGEISNEIVRLKEANAELEKQLAKINESRGDRISDKDTAELVLQILDTYFEHFDTMDLMQKRDMMKFLIKNIVITGDKVEINFLGEGKINSLPMSEYFK